MIGYMLNISITHFNIRRQAKTATMCRQLKIIHFSAISSSGSSSWAVIIQIIGLENKMSKQVNGRE
jgi:hypothetical protein